MASLPRPYGRIPGVSNGDSTGVSDQASLSLLLRGLEKLGRGWGRRWLVFLSRPCGRVPGIRGRHSELQKLADEAVGVLEQLRDDRIALRVWMEPVGADPFGMLTDLGAVEVQVD